MPSVDSFNLSRGSLKDAFSLANHDKVEAPLTFLVTNIKPVMVDNEVKRYRLIVTDGIYSCQGLIEEVAMPYVIQNSLSRFAIIKVLGFNVFATQRKLLFLINELVIVGQADTYPESNGLITIDNYFKDHPEDDYLVITKNNQPNASNDNLSDDVHGTTSPAPPAQQQSNFNTPPVSAGTERQQQQQAPQQQSYQQPPSSGNDEKVVPIDNISPYRNFWTIKARVSYKGDLRTWQNKNNEGKLFSVNFLDESDEIKASAFNDDAENAFKLLEEGKVYFISNAKVKAKNPKFNHLANPYELVIDKGTKIAECYDNSNVPKLSFKFVKLDKIEKLDPNSIIDVIGALKTVNEPFQITARSTGKPFDRRNVTIVDETGYAIDVGLWNATAVGFNIPEGSVIAFKSCKVQDFNGRSLTLTQSGSIIPNPDVSEAYTLKGWYDNEGIKESFTTLKVESTASSSSFSKRITIKDAESGLLGQSDKPDYFTVKASISYTKHDTFCYPACSQKVQYSADTNRPASECNRKLIEQQHDGTWRCERCDINVNEPTYRYIFNCAILDSTSQIWITLFDAEAKKLLGMPASELLKLKQKKDYDESNTEFLDTFANVTFKQFNFRIKAKQDTYNDAVRVRYQCVGVDFLDFNAEADYLSQQLDLLLK